MRFSPKIVKALEEQYMFAKWEEMYTYDAYWYEYMNEIDKREYRAYLKRVEPLTDMNKNMEPYSMANLIMA